jgi:hypothetical protein
VSTELIVAVGFALAVPSLAACGDDSDSAPAPAEESAEKPSKPTPLSCLEEAGLLDARCH